MPDSPVLQVGSAVAALVLAAVFCYAAVAKLSDRQRTAEDFLSMGLPDPGRLAILVPLLELGTAACLVVAPGWGGVLAVALLVGFTTNLVLVMRSGRVATCACFGGSSAEPISVGHLIRNAGLGALGLLSALFDGWIWQVL
ncbi:MAG: MauE/DoxX family redox-associated membrane protein [Actinomycetota bacterium]